MPPIRIALCITDLDVGGAERCVMQLVTRLDRERFDPVVYCLAPEPAEPEASCAEPIRAAGVPVHCLGARHRWQSPWIVGKLARRLRQQRPQLIQTMLFHANVVGTLAARLAGVPRIVTGIRVAERGERWHGKWSKRLGQRVDRHVCVSRDVAAFVEAEMRLPRDVLTVIPNGVDLNRFPAGEPGDLTGLGIPPGRRIVASIGRWEPQKGIDWLIESAGQWLERLPDHDLLLVGRGSLEAHLRGLVAKRGVEDRVHFAGWRPDVPEILAASELLVLPSQWEGMPNVVLEAMAARLPVVASDVEGVRELLGEQAAEQTVPFGDDQALADRLVQILADRDLAEQLGAANRRRVEQQFSLDAMVEAYQRLWESLVP